MALPKPSTQSNENSLKSIRKIKEKNSKLHMKDQFNKSFFNQQRVRSYNQNSNLDNQPYVQLQKNEFNFYNQQHAQSQNVKLKNNNSDWNQLALDALSKVNAPTKEKDLISLAIIKALAYCSGVQNNITVYNLSSLSTIAVLSYEHVMKATNGNSKLAAIAEKTILEAGLSNEKKLKPQNSMPISSLEAGLSNEKKLKTPNSIPISSLEFDSKILNELEFETDSITCDISISSNSHSLQSLALIRSMKRDPRKSRDDRSVMTSVSKFERGILRSPPDPRKSRDDRSVTTSVSKFERGILRSPPDPRKSRDDRSVMTSASKFERGILRSPPDPRKSRDDRSVMTSVSKGERGISRSPPSSPGK